MSDGIQLYDLESRRLYLTVAERDTFLDAATQADRPVRTLCAVLYYTGCRISESLALRRGYAIHALPKNVPLNMVSKWMGHSQMETTAIYANAVGEEQQSIAARMWS
jgi:site-specific recombinase XerD